MKALKVDFAPARSVPPWLWWTLVAACLSMAAYQGWQAVKVQRRLVASEADSVAVASRLDAARMARQDAENRRSIAPPYAQDAAAIARTAAFPLDRVLTAIEKTQVEGVRVTALDVASDEGAVRLELEFTDQEGLMRYLDELNAGEEATRWRLVQAQAGTGPMGTATVESRWNATAS